MEFMKQLGLGFYCAFCDSINMHILDMKVEINENF